MSTQPPREQQILISALGREPLELTLLLCRAAQDSRCTILGSKLTSHGEYSALVLHLGGSWDALVRMEVCLEQIGKRHDISLNHVRCPEASSHKPALPYLVYVSAAFQPDTLTELCTFFDRHNIDVTSISYDSSQAPQTHTLMLNATITVALPVDTQINLLREQFLEFADYLNLDAMIEPWRPHFH